MRERKPVSYDEKALEAKRYNDVFEFMNNETELKQGKKARCARCQARSNLGFMCIPIILTEYCYKRHQPGCAHRGYADGG